jgi:hypothetical protein
MVVKETLATILSEVPNITAVLAADEKVTADTGPLLKVPVINPPAPGKTTFTPEENKPPVPSNSLRVNVKSTPRND